MNIIRFLNGNVYTMDAQQPRAQAIAIDTSNGHIVAVGSDDEVRRSGGQRGETIDLRGRTMLPGFIDAHIHLLEAAYRAEHIDAGDCPHEDAVAELVRQRTASTPAGRWIQGGHWDKNAWPGGRFPSKTSLDAVAPHHPVALWSKDGHLLWVNSLALQRANIHADTPQPANGHILRDGAGEPTGILQEAAATSLVARVIERRDPEMNRALLRRIISDLQRRGITTIHDIEGEETLSIFQEMRDQGTLGVRVEMILPRTMLPQLRERGISNAEQGRPQGSPLQWPSGAATPYHRRGVPLWSPLLRINGIKIFADGTLGSQTAAMLESFEGSPGNYGILALPEQEMMNTVRDAAALGLSIAIHAIGDRAARVALNSIEYAQQHLAAERTDAPHIRYRVEHVQLITPEDLERMQRLGGVASIQPYHAVADRDIAERYWGRRHRHAYAYRTMRDMGIPIALGSDAPVETYDPLSILYAATQRRDPGVPRPPWLPDQVLPVTDALWGYTLGSAYAGGEEARKGSLSVGKLGDAIVLREDILGVPQEHMNENGVQATILGGRIVYGSL